MSNCKSYIKSPLNYIGGKYKLLNQIIPLFPKNITTFVDLFGGGFNVGINIEADKIIYNDINVQVVELLEHLSINSVETCLEQIDKIIFDYKLSKTNKEGFLKLRNDYNMNPNPFLFYTVVCYSFNNQIRFNKKNEYNMPFGMNRSSFNDVLRKKFILFINKLHNKNFTFLSEEFDNIKIPLNSFVYCDPPYLNSVASYL